VKSVGKQLRRTSLFFPLQLYDDIVIGSLASSTSKEPFTPVQLLWLNLIMDTLAALALATEKPDDACLYRNPVYKQAGLTSNRMKTFILVNAVFECAIIFLHMFSSHEWLETYEGDANICNIPGQVKFMPDGNVTAQWKYCSDACTNEGGTFISNRWCQQGTHHSTIIFNVFIWMQIFNIFNARILHGGINPFNGLFTRSLNLCIIVVLISGFQAFAIEVAGPFMHTVGLNGTQWGVSIGFGALQLPVGILIRLLPIKDEIPQEVVAKQEKERGLRRSLGLAVDDAPHQFGSSILHSTDMTTRRMIVKK